MYIKFTIGAQTKSGPSDQRGETKSRWMSSMCKTPLTKLHVLPLLSPPCQSGSKPPSSSPLLAGHIVTARRTHHHCSPNPSPLLAEPIAAARQTHRPARWTHRLNSLSLSAMKSTHLQALTPPFSAINASVQHQRFDEYRFNFFFTKSEKNRRNKPKQNDLSQKFSNWRRFFQKIAEISLFTEISEKFLRFLAKFLDISVVDISPSSFISPPAETRNFAEKNRNFQPWSQPTFRHL